MSVIVLFVCEHGSAKSTIAAAHFNKLARERNLKVKAISRGTDPDETFPANVTAGLLDDGLHAGQSKPEKLRDRDLEAAARVVFFNGIPAEYPAKLLLRDWSNVPPVSEDYGAARDEIVKRVKSLLEEFRNDDL